MTFNSHSSLRDFPPCLRWVPAFRCASCRATLMACLRHSRSPPNRASAKERVIGCFLAFLSKFPLCPLRPLRLIRKLPKSWVFVRETSGHCRACARLVEAIGGLSFCLDWRITKVALQGCPNVCDFFGAQANCLVEIQQHWFRICHPK